MSSARFWLLLLLGSFASCQLYAQLDLDGVHWHLAPVDSSFIPFAESSSSDTAFIFVHGLYGDNGKTWAHQNGSGYDQYWPYLVWNDFRLRADRAHSIRPSVYLAGYSCGPNYSLDDATTQVLSGMRDYQVLNRYSRIIFVAHSLGGVVVRNLFVHSWSLFRRKKIGLVLVASPTQGSAWANVARLVSDTMGKPRYLEDNHLIKTLTQDNELLDSIDVNFRNLVAGVDIDDVERPRFFLGEAAEQYGPFPRSTEIPLIVQSSSSRHHLGITRTIPDTNHFSIAKPEDQWSPVHRFLVDFYESFQREFSPPGDAPVPVLTTELTPPIAPMPPIQPVEPGGSIPPGLQDQLSRLVMIWGDSFREGNLLSLRNLYAAHLDIYFDRGDVAADEALQSAQRMSQQYPRRELSLSKPVFRRQGQGEIEAVFCKSFHYSNAAEADHVGTVLSYMHFQMSGNKWHLTGLCDEGVCKGGASAEEFMRSQIGSCAR